MIAHLNKTRKTLELCMAIYGMFFGTGIFLSIMAGGSPLYWLNLTVQQQGDAALGIMLFGLLHAVGVRLNGSWCYSPALRAIGMFGHTIAMAYITVISFVATVNSPHGLASGFFTYSGITFVFFALALGSLKDLRISLNLKAQLNG